MTIGNRIKTLRKAMRITQGELAKKIDVAQSLIAYLESGSGVGSTHIASIARALNADAHWLETGEGSPKLLQSVEIEKKYCKEIEEAIEIMSASDDRGRLQMLIALQDIFEERQARQKSLPLPREEDAKAMEDIRKKMLPEFIEAQNGPSDLYKSEKSQAPRIKGH